MALKFRRGTTAQKSGSLAFGEPFVNTTLGTLQIGLDTGDVTLSKQIDSSSNVVVNSLSASSFVSASSLHITGNGEIKGNLTLRGNITIGDQTSDTVSVTANLSSSLIPETTNAFNLGSVTKAWKDLYISTASIKIVDTSTNTVVGTLSSNANGDLNISGQLSASSIAGLGVIQVFSSSLNQRLDSIQTTSSSLLSRVNSIETTTASFGQSFQTYSSSLNAYTASNNTTNNTQNSRLTAIESTTASLNTTTASLNTTTASLNGRVSSLESTSASLVTFSSSVAAGIQFTGSNVTIKGDLLVKGTTTTINSTVLDIADNIIQLNGGGNVNGGLVVRDATGGTTVSGSLLWDTTNDYWKAGPNGTEDRIVLATEFNSFTSSHQAAQNADNLRLNALQTATASLNTYTASNDTTNNAQNVRLNTLENTTASLNSFTSSTSTNLTTIGSRVGALEVESGSVRTAFNSYTSSTNSTISALNTSTASINTATASFSTKVGLLETSTGSLNSYTASNNTNISAIHTSTGSLNTYTASNDAKISAIHTATASLNTYTSSQNTYNSGINSYTASNNTNISAIHTATSSLNTATSSLNTFTSSINTTIKSKLNTDGVVSGSSQITLGSTTGYTTYTGSVASLVNSTSASLSSSIATTTNALSTSIAVTNASQDSRIASIESISGSFARTNTANTFIGNQTITGSLYVSQDLIIAGSSSIQNISSSNVIIGASYVTLNAFNPASRFAGLKIYDSGSNAGTASLVWDSLNNKVLYQHPSGADTYNSAWLISGPMNAGALGSETGLTINKIQKATDDDHIGDSNISDNGSVVSINSNTQVTGSLVVSNGISGQINATNGVVSGSSQIDATATTNWASGIKTQLNTNGVISGSSQVFSNVSGDITIAANGVATISADSVVLGTDTTGNYVASLVAGSGITLSNNTGEGATPTIALTNNAITIAGQSTSLGGSVTAATIGAAIGAFSGSSQIDHNSTTNYDANKHVDHTTVSISAGIGLTGGGTIAATRTLSIDTATTATVTGSQTLTNKTIAAGSNTISGLTNANLSGTAGITNANLANSTITIAGTSTALGSSISAATILSGTSVVSGSSQVSYTGLSNTPAGIVSGSSQIDHNATTNYSANRHIDHTAVSIATGFGLSGGGDISTTRTLSVDTTGVASISGSQTLTNKTISGASNTLSNIGNASLTNSSVTVTAGTGMSGGGAVSLGSSITLTNAGVTSNVAGTGVTVSGATGAVTISIGQAVATSSNVQFNSLGIGMAASAVAGEIKASADIIAYASSDKRLKENIKPIENSLDKISKISGNTYDWKEGYEEIHSHKGNDVGLIAQEIEAVLPQLVTTREHGFKAVQYDKLVALLVEGIKEQQIQINDMKVEIENLKKQKGL